MSQEDPTLPLRPGPRDVGESPTLPAHFDPGAAADGIVRGTAVGRYLILDPLGEGGMGIVYSAYDPELDRRIAIKLLRASGDSEGSGGRSRLLREAQALARLTHANVITVYDVGTFHGGVFVAMELVEGWTLRAWQKHPGRTWREKLDVYLAAGRGLGAAHAAGLVHRDFKPDNVLIGRDRRVRVTDFGLVRAANPEEPAQPPPVLPRYDGPLGATPGLSARSGSLTAAGALLGTPHYMAPEQHRGQLADERSDQFSFCVATWEALVGERPFDGETLAELADAVVNHELRTPPARASLPPRVVRALEKGMAAEPKERHASMNALLAELTEATRVRARGPMIAAIGAVLALGAGGVAMATLVGGAEAQKPCAAAGEGARALWNDAARARVRAAFLATGAPFAEDAYRGVAQILDGWTVRHASMARESCLATRVEGTQSESLGDLRSSCLDRRLASAGELVERFAAADRAIVEDAVETAGGLPDLAACADAAALTARAPLPGSPVERTRIDAAFDALAELEAERAAHARAADLRLRAGALVDEARATGYAPLIAAALLLRGRIEADDGDGRAARDSLLEAAAIALEGGDDEALAGACLELVLASTELLADYGEAGRWAQLAEGSIARLAAPAREQQKLLHARGRLYRADGKPSEARAELEQALVVAEQHLGAEHPAAANTLTDLGLAALDLGQIDEAEQFFVRALAIAQALYGPSHPWVATAKHDLAIVAYKRGKYEQARTLLVEVLALREQLLGPDDRQIAKTVSALGAAELALGLTKEALAHMQRALALDEQRFGPDHPEVAASLNELAGVFHKLGDYVSARDANLRALAIREKTLGPDHPEVGYSLVNVGIEQKALGQLADVEANYRRAIAIFEAKLGAQNPTTGIAYINLGEVLRVAGKLEPALAAYERARVITEAAFGKDHPIMGHVLNGVGQAELARGRVKPAIAALEAALLIREKDPGDAEALAETRFALARALVADRGGDGAARAKQLAADARAGYAKLGEPFAKQRAAIDAWLAARR